MHIGCESLVGDHFPTYGSKGCALFRGQRGANIGFMLGGYPGKLFQQLSAGFGEGKLGLPPVLPAAPPFHQSLFRQLINQNDHSALKETALA